jgi:signal transduction histidine kinase/CheY-like chemotaxis protein
MMNTTHRDSRLTDELHISPAFALAGLALAGLLSALASDFQFTAGDRERMLVLSAICYLTLIACWLAPRWLRVEQRTLNAVALMLLVVFGAVWLGQPVLLIFVPVTMTVTVDLIGFPGATRVAAVASVALLAVSLWLTGLTLILVLMALWLTLGLLRTLYGAMLQVSEWSWSNYRQRLALLEEARDRKADLEQALDELVHANRQLDLLNERLSAARLMAEEAHKAKAAFVAKVSHEFRTPLNMIIGLTDLAVETPDVYGQPIPPGLAEDLHIVHRNCEHLADMVNDVLDLSQAESARLALRREIVDLGEEIQAAVEVVQPLVEKKKLTLRVHVPADLPTVYCDRTRIRQVILNLVSNAARYTETGGIEVKAAGEDNCVVISVQDTGPGIAAAEVEKIFEPFYQAAGGAWRDRGGSGLGLTISRQFIELHGGQIWVQSEVGRGSCFAFRLPITPISLPLPAPNRWINEEWVWRERSARPAIPNLPYRRRFVLWDQTQELAPVLTEQTDSIELATTHDLAHTLEALNECPAHGVIVNASSPDQVWPLVDHIREAVDDTPIIGYCLPERVDPVLASGVLDYLTKPITRADLRKVLASTAQPIRRVLVVDDNEDFRQLLARMLHTLHPTASIAESADGSYALELMRKQPPDLVFLDISMPNLDGWQLLAAMHEDEALAGVPAVIVSAQDPVDPRVQSGALIATLGAGIPVSKLLVCALALSELLLKPETSPPPTPGSALDDALALSDNAARPGPTPALPDAPRNR